MRRPRVVPLLLLVLLVPAGCTRNVATGRYQFHALSREESIALGEQSRPELIEQYGGEVESPELRSYVEQVGARLAETTEPDYPGLPWDFTVLDSDVINAFALPGGKVFVSRGLMQRLDDEAQLAGVLGHEIGHVTGEHVSEKVGQQLLVRGIQIGALVAAGATRENWAIATAVVVGAAGQGYLLSFNRSQEVEADTLALRYMTRSGYDPEAMVGLLEVLADAAGDSRGIEFLSTHPHPETRIRTVSRLLETDYQASRDNPAYRRFRDRYHREALPFMPASDPQARASAAGWCLQCRPAAALPRSPR